MHDTNQRAATRSMVALSFVCRGCRCDPATWDFSHLRGVLEDSLRGRCRYLGDAFMLSEILLDGELRKEREPEAWRRVFGQGGVHRWELAGALPIGDPLHAGAQHFVPPASPLLFEPAERGGLGLTPDLSLMEAGVVACGHMCAAAFKGSGAEGRWIIDYEEARQRHRELSGGKLAEAAWGRVFDELEGMGIEPVGPERACCGALERGWESEGSGERGEVDIVELDKLRELARREAELPAAGQADAARWQAAVGKAVGSTLRRQREGVAYWLSRLNGSRRGRARSTGHWRRGG